MAVFKAVGPGCGCGVALDDERQRENEATVRTSTARTSGRDEVSVGDEEFVAVVLLQDVGEDLQGEAFLLSGLLTPLVRVHFGVGQVRVIVFVFCPQRAENGNGKFLYHKYKVLILYITGKLPPAQKL